MCLFTQVSHTQTMADVPLALAMDEFTHPVALQLAEFANNLKVMQASMRGLESKMGSIHTSLKPIERVAQTKVTVYDLDAKTKYEKQAFEQKMVVATQRAKDEGCTVTEALRRGREPWIHPLQVCGVFVMGMVAGGYASRL